MTTLLCAPVTAKNFTTAINQLNQIEKEADIVELRLDLMNNISKKGIEYIIKKSKKPVIVTFRSTKEGGNERGNEKTREEFLIAAIRAGAQFVDIELSTNVTMRNLIVGFAKKNGTKVIISFHDFKKTPSLKKLTAFANAARKAGADIIKTATWKQKTIDNKTAEKLLTYCNTKKIPGIVLTMSKTDASMRFNAIKLGAFLTFGRVGKGSAPGQPTLSELKKYKTKLFRAKPTKKIPRRKTLPKMRRLR